MSISNVGLPPHWQYYSERAAETHQGRVDDFGHGREEQLNETLRFIESGKPFTDAAREKLDNLPRNRTKKYTRLRKRTEELSVVRHPKLGTFTVRLPAISYCDDFDAPIHGVHESLAPAEWLVECNLAYGESYAAIATRSGVTQAALKMRVLRWRTTLRDRKKATD